MRRLEDGDPLGSAPREDHAIAFVLERAPRERAVGVVVVDDEDGGALGLELVHGVPRGMTPGAEEERPARKERGDANIATPPSRMVTIYLLIRRSAAIVGNDDRAS